ncbi:MAG: penicillin acylase family protein [Anaerolineae bacterium]|nr:penicillin acylase family protein [Anaerolineae bacterium]MCI0695454.1 penicillin acylase family protein [candidate division KSB1 bacterium]
MKQSVSITVFFAAIVFFLTVPATLLADTITLTAPDGTTVTIYRDSYGVPHIVGESESGVFFGQGFAVAQDRLFQLELFRRNAEGKLAEWFGSDYLESDGAIRTLFYTTEERRQQFNALPMKFKTMLESYRDGINTYLDSMATNPAKYKPIQFRTFPMERWTVYKSIAIIQLISRFFGQGGGEELDRLVELRQNGQAWFDLNRPINDPSAPTTIRGGGSATIRNWSYSGMRVREEVIASLTKRRYELKSRAEALRLPLKWGSFAVLISTTKSNSGNVMLLGAPQTDHPPEEDEPSIPNEVELDCPTFHVGGIAIAGIPSLVIGHTEHHAWSITSAGDDNSDVYIDSTMEASFNKYVHNGQWLNFEAIQDTIISLGAQIPFTHYRTIHGPVFGDDLQNHQVFSLKMTFWNQELDMLKFVDGAIRATNLEEFESAVSFIPLGFNLFYAGKDQKIKFWHAGKYQDRSDGVDPRLPHKGDGTEEWGGFINFADLPQADNTAQDYFVNWNNKPVIWWDNGDNIGWVGPDHVTNIGNFVDPINGFSFSNLKDVARQINDRGTYEQAIEFTASEIIDENILAPGQSGFISLTGQPSPHFSDQWSSYGNWGFKDMEFGQVPVSVASEDRTPATFTLAQNYPNPFLSEAKSPAKGEGNPETVISYQLPVASEVRLTIFNALGQEIRTLVNGRQSPGQKSAVWDGKNDHGQAVNSGIYFYTLKAGDRVQTKKMVLMR